MKIRINVKQEHIDNGECRNPAKCAIALAVIDVFTSVSICTDSIFCHCTSKRIAWLPQEAEEAIVDFDPGIKIKPFLFVIDIDDNYLESIIPGDIEKAINESLNCEVVPNLS